MDVLRGQSAFSPAVRSSLAVSMDLVVAFRAFATLSAGNDRFTDLQPMSEGSEESSRVR